MVISRLYALAFSILVIRDFLLVLILRCFICVRFIITVKIDFLCHNKDLRQISTQVSHIGLWAPINEAILCFEVVASKAVIFLNQASPQWTQLADSCQFGSRALDKHTLDFSPEFKCKFPQVFRSNVLTVVLRTLFRIKRNAKCTTN